MAQPNRPQLTRVLRDGCAFWYDEVLASAEGVVVAFSGRVGGCSKPPFASLNLASHVGDRPEDVDANRTKLLEVIGLASCRNRLTTAEQVHGEKVVLVKDAEAGAGAFACSGTSMPIAGTDALVTELRLAPLMLAFADCVPVVLVAPGPLVAVVHAGWRGALASLPGKAVREMCELGGVNPEQVRAYIGAHIRACHYPVDDRLMSQFFNVFDTFARAESGGLDLDAVVSASLHRAGVAACNIARLGLCTAETTDRFFSYRAEGGVTGRHAALACIL